MIVLKRVGELRNFLRMSGSVGFVPTMGALHAGHMSLVARARKECRIVVVSIFVNPAQFGPQEDLSAYPRPIAADLAACEAARVDVVFVPPAEEMYPEPPATRVVVTGVAEPLEGAHRPGHFDGVSLVVCKLLSIVGPCRAYFGRKDAQQLRVVSRMVADLNLDAEIVPCPTVRDDDGLALSSRNAYLSAEERARALALPRALEAARAAVDAGEQDAAVVVERARQALSDVDVDYLECVDPDTFEPVKRIDRSALVAAAVRVGRTRLIDNVVVGEDM